MKNKSLIIIALLSLALYSCGESPHSIDGKAQEEHRDDTDSINTHSPSITAPKDSSNNQDSQ